MNQIFSLEIEGPIRSISVSCSTYQLSQLYIIYNLVNLVFEKEKEEVLKFARDYFQISLIRIFEFNMECKHGLGIVSS